MNTRPQTIDALNHTLQSPPASVYALHPDWIRTANERFVLDPGLPDVRNWITGVVAEIVKTMRSTAFSLTIISITKRRNRRWMMKDVSRIRQRICRQSRLAQGQHAAIDKTGFSHRPSIEARGCVWRQPGGRLAKPGGRS